MCVVFKITNKSFSMQLLFEIDNIHILYENLILVIKVFIKKNKQCFHLKHGLEILNA